YGVYEVNGKNLKLFKTTKEDVIPQTAPGEFISDGKTYLKFAAIDGYINVLDLQLEGKKRMNVEELLRGFRL
ncbi:MAG: methionyl-tRNA formyltransferase, partial [Pedobacter sp.]